MKLRVTVNGRDYEVEVEVLDDEMRQVGHAAPAQAPAIAPTAIEQPSVPAPASADGHDGDENVYRSPMSGVVARISVEVGQSVQQNEELLVLEAMKMETALTAQQAGKVLRIHTSVGDSVQVKQVLVEFE